MAQSIVILTCSECEDGTYRPVGSGADAFSCDNADCDHVVSTRDIEPNLEVGEHLTMHLGRLAYIPIEV